MHTRSLRRRQGQDEPGAPPRSPRMHCAASLMTSRRSEDQSSHRATTASPDHKTPLKRLHIPAARATCDRWSGRRDHLPPREYDFFCVPPLAHHREINLENCAGIHAAPHPDLAAMIFDDVLYDPQPEAGSLLTLGGHKRLKDRRHDVAGNTAAGVGHEKAHPAVYTVVRGQVPRADFKLTPRAHAVFGIND